MARGLKTFVWLLAPALGLWAYAPVMAQSVKKPAAKTQTAGQEGTGAKANPAAAQKAFEAGAKAFEAGKNDQAIASLSTAISSGGLQSQQMAKALYYRGVAYRRQGKPAQAISDLTSALWLKGGLAENERAVAMENRAGAYREAGLIDGTQVDQARNTALAGRPAAVTEKPQPAPARAAAAAPAAAPAPASSWQSATAVRQAPATTAAVAPSPTMPSPPAAAVQQAPVSLQPASPQPSTTQRRAPFPDGNAAYTERTVTPYTAAVREQVATAPSASEQAAARPEQSSAGSSSGGGFFKSILGDLSLGGSPPKRPEPQPTQVASQVASTSSGNNWSETTRVVTPGTKQQVAVAPPAPATAAPAPVGNFRLQVAAVRTRREAEGVSTRLRQQHSKELKSRGVEIDEAVLPNVGTFYRVRVGPYVEANEPRNLCVKLRQKGYDCLVVSISQ